MKECPEKISLLMVTILTIAVFTTFLIGQTHEAQDPSSYQPTEASGQEPTTNKISSKSQSKKIVSGSGQTLKELKSKRVESKNGDKLGSISDVIIDTQSGRAVYVVIATGGVAGIGKKEKVVPPSAVSTATTKRDVVSLDATQDRWNRAPTFHKKQLAALSDPVQSQKINQYYQQNASLAGQTPSPAPLPPTGRTEGQMKLASELIGKKVINGHNQEIGKISDVLVDISQPENKPAFAILKPASWVTEANGENRGKLLAVPVKLLRLSSNKGKLTLNINSEQLKQPQPLTLESWSSTSSGTGVAVVYTYQSNGFHPQGAKPDNTRLNQQNQQPSAITPENQSETKEDLQLTQDIRRTLVQQDGLSTRGKNVKIISSNGRVMLRGPVSSQHEKNLIGQLAEQVAGAGKVDNQLEVTNK